MKIRLLMITSLILPVFLQFASAEEPANWTEKNLDELVKIYLHLHRNPELSFQEEKTAQFVGKHLSEAGCEVTQNVGGFGVVGVLANGDGPTVMIRTDLDALPIVEQTNQPYASTVKVEDANGSLVGVMHACGHDVHMTNVIATARYLSEHKDQWQGTAIFIGQPAEERGSGANAMIDDGLFERFPKPDYGIALHVSPTVPAGHIAMRAGYLMANVDSVDVTLYGRGGHGAAPHTTIDPIVQAAKFVLDVQTIISREIDPIESGVITVGSIHAGTKHNIIPDSCHLQLTVRSYSEEVRQHLIEAIRRKAAAAATSVGADEPTVVLSEGTPSLSNDPELTQRLKVVLEETIGAENVETIQPAMVGEDFSQYHRRGEFPTVMYWLGVVEQKRLDRYEDLGVKPPSLHSAGFYPDIEPSLKTGATTMCAAALELLKK